MARLDIPHLRLHNQHISRPTFRRPAEVVAWFGAVQAQDYLGALWAIGLRMQKAIEAEVERAVAKKAIIRTWPMRGTLHFVAAEDVRWMLELLTPRIIANRLRGAYQYYGLDEATFSRSKDLFADALHGGRRLARRSMYAVLESANISTTGGRGLHILSRLAHDGFLCFAAREGKQPTFALLDEWVPGAKRLEREEALAEIAKRYFTSHGPATLQDFVWWSGLPAAEARTALSLAQPRLAQDLIEGQTYWLSPSTTIPKKSLPDVYLLPPYDEYAVAYRDRSAILDPAYTRRLHTGNGIFSPIIVIKGQVAGTWKREIKRDGVEISLSPFTTFSKSETRAIRSAADRYGEFLGSPVRVR